MPSILDRLGEALGDERARRFHVHFSRIEFSAGGEKRHWTFAQTQFGPEPQPLMELLAERRLAAGHHLRERRHAGRGCAGDEEDVRGGCKVTLHKSLSQRESLQRLYPTLFVIFIVFFAETPCQTARDWVK